MRLLIIFILFAATAAYLLRTLSGTMLAFGVSLGTYTAALSLCIYVLIFVLGSLSLGTDSEKRVKVRVNAKTL